MARLLYLVRHGRVDGQDERLLGRAAGHRLGSEGRAQAEAAALKLAVRDVEQIYASPLERTRETAEIISAGIGAPIENAPDLLEVDFGAWSGESFSTLAQDERWRLWNADRGRIAAPEGESMAETQVRAARWLSRLDKSRGGAAAAISHGDVIKALVAHVLGLPLHFYDRFEIDFASITTISLGASGARLLRLNESPHA